MPQAPSTWRRKPTVTTEHVTGSEWFMLHPVRLTELNWTGPTIYDSWYDYDRYVKIMRLCYLARSENLPKGLYILPMFFLFFYFFNARRFNTCLSEANGSIFTKISKSVDWCKACSPHWVFFDFSRNVAMATNVSLKIGVFQGAIYFVRCHSETDCNIAIPISKD